MDQLILAVANIQAAQDNLREGWFEKIRAHCEGLKDLFKTDPSLTQKNGDKSWTALGVFYRPGIKVLLPEPAQENGADMFALYGGQGTNPGKYKYRKGTQEEVERAGLVFEKELSIRSSINANDATSDRSIKPSHLSQAMINVETRTGNMQTQLELLQRQLQQEQARRIELEEKMASMMQVLTTLQSQAAIQLPANVNANNLFINTPGAPGGNRNIYQASHVPGSSSNTMKKK